METVWNDVGPVGERPTRDSSFSAADRSIDNLVVDFYVLVGQSFALWVTNEPSFVDRGKHQPPNLRFGWEFLQSRFEKRERRIRLMFPREIPPLISTLIRIR